VTRRLLYGICGAAMGGLVAFSVTAGTTLASMTFAVIVGAAVTAVLSVRYGDAFWHWLSDRLRWLA
jgi:hypothetical protein